MNFVELFFLFILVAIAGYIGIRFYRWYMGPKEESEANYRMMVAVRRRQAGISRFIEMDIRQQEAHVQEIDRKWKALLDLFSSFGEFKEGFMSPDAGLPSSGEDDWTVFGFYDLPDYTAFQNCKTMLEDDQFTLLRNVCEIRLLFGELSDSFRDLKKLF